MIDNRSHWFGKLQMKHQIDRDDEWETVLGITLLKVAGVILPLLNSLLYSTHGSHYSTHSLLYSKTHYSTQEAAGVIKVSK